MKNAKLINENSIELNEKIDNNEQENLTIWTVGGMMLIWIYVIIMSLF
jgi:hypothetical protein